MHLQAFSDIFGLNNKWCDSLIDNGTRVVAYNRVKSKSWSNIIKLRHLWTNSYEMIDEKHSGEVFNIICLMPLR